MKLKVSSCLIKIETSADNFMNQKGQNDNAKKIDDTIEGFYNSDYFEHSENSINDFSRFFNKNQTKTNINSNKKYGSKLLKTNSPKFNKSI